MQLVLVIVILVLCAAYVGWRLYRNLTTPADPCAGCEGCELKDRMCQKQKKGCCCSKNS